MPCWNQWFHIIEAQYLTPDVVTCAPQKGQKLDGLVVRFSITTGAGEWIGCATFCLFYHNYHVNEYG